MNAQFTGNLEAACELHERCAAMCRELGFASLRARALQLLGIARLDLGDLTAARAALQEGLPASVASATASSSPIGLTGFAGLAAKTGKHRMALRLAGAAEAYRDTYESALPEPNRAYLDSWLAPSLKTVGAAAARLIAEGRQMTLTAALEYALANEPEEAWRPGPRQALTRRETRSRHAGGPWPDQPRHRRPAVPVGPHGRSARRPHPDQAGLPHPHPAGSLGARGRTAGRKYVVAK